MKNLLMNCYYDGMTIKEAIDFIGRCYWEVPTEKQIENAKRIIKDCTNKEWS